MTIHEEYLHYQEKFEKQYGHNTLVLEQVGSFFEAYATEERGHNLHKISELLNYALTRKNKTIKEISINNPYLVGIPLIAIDKCLKLLINNGYTVVLIEQVTPPPNPKRKVTQIYSPGTFISEMQPADSNNICCLYLEAEKQKNGLILLCIGMSVVDLTTGENSVHEVFSKDGDEKFALDEAVRFLNSNSPKEIILFSKSGENKDFIINYLELTGKNYQYYTNIDKKFFKISYVNAFLKKIYTNVGMLSMIEYLDLELKPYAMVSLVLLFDFAYQHNENIINHLYKPTIFEDNRHLILGNNAIHQLNIIEGDSGRKNRFNSLFDVVNNTSTAMGKRLLKQRLISPIIDEANLEDMYNCVDQLIDSDLYVALENYLNGILDLERLNRRLSIGFLNPFEFINMYNSYQEVINIFELVKKKRYLKKFHPDKGVIKSLNQFVKDVQNVFNIDECEKFSLSNLDRNIFNKGVYGELDRLQEEIDEGQDFMDNICSVLSSYIEKGDKLKIKLHQNQTEGHYLKLTKIRADLLKEQLKKMDEIKITKHLTIKTSELVFKDLPKAKETKIYLTQLKDRSTRVIEIQNRIIETVRNGCLEQYRLFHAKYNETFKTCYQLVAMLDLLKSNAKTAKLYNYCRPQIAKKANGFIRCKELRHPIVERIRTDVEYVPYDIVLGKTDDNDLEGMLIFGLNSVGKSTMMKSVGISIIMAQSGMFVPATEYTYSPYTTLFARITGNDNIFKGLSSFALEMTELRAILKRTDKKTLVIGDEICRGTEHISGNSIVAASIVQLAKTSASFIFATHLHELPKLRVIEELQNVKSFHLTVMYDQENDRLIFDRRLKPGSGEQIYGILVAKYIIDDPEFIAMCHSIKDDLLDRPKELLTDRRSRYNSNVILDQCIVCKKKENLETHHINFQKDCEDGFVKNKPYLKMNSEANLGILCGSCHDALDRGEIQITGYLDTSQGRGVEIVKNPNPPKKKKYKTKEIKIIEELKKENITSAKAKNILKKNHNITISKESINKIWDGKY